MIPRQKFILAIQREKVFFMRQLRTPHVEGIVYGLRIAQKIGETLHKDFIEKERRHP